MSIRKFFNKPIYKIIILRKHQKTMFVDKIIKRKTPKSIENLRHQISISINIDKPAFIYLNERTYFIDIETNNQMSFTELKSKMTTKELDSIVGTKILRELTTGILDNKKEKILYIITGIVIGALAGCLIMQSIMQNKINELYNSISTTVLPF